METRHIRLNYAGALTAKKDLIGSEISLLHILKKIKSYKALRKKEVTLKNKLRIELGKFRKKMDSLKKDLPSEDIKIDKRKSKKKEKKDSGERNLDRELAEIKKKLAGLK